MDLLTEPGYTGLFLAGFLAATFIPFSSELLFSAMIYGGYNFFLCLITAAAGNTLGGMFNYMLGYIVKWDWLEKYMNISMERVRSLQSGIRNRIAAASLLCWLPVIGDPIAVALGVMKAPVLRVLVFMFAGKFLRYLVLGLVTLKIIRLWL